MDKRSIGEAMTTAPSIAARKRVRDAAFARVGPSRPRSLELPVTPSSAIPLLPQRTAVAFSSSASSADAAHRRASGSHANHASSIHPTAYDDDAWSTWCIYALFYVAVWVATWATAHVQPPLALGVALAFVIVPGLYILLRMRVERIAPRLHRDRWCRG